jgi:acyl carrier protein
MVNQEETFDKFKSIVADILQVEPDKIVLGAKFGDDLEADSLDLVELVMALEEEFNVEINEEELNGVETVGQAYDLLTSKI